MEPDTVIREYAFDEIVEFLNKLAAIHWTGHFEEKSNYVRFDLLELADLNKELLKKLVADLSDPCPLTPDMLPLLWPAIMAAGADAPGMANALEALLFSPPIEFVCGRIADTVVPDGFVKFVEYWAPAIRYFANHNLIRHPEHNDRLPEAALEILEGLSNEACEFLELEKEQKLALAADPEFRTRIEKLLVDPIHRWIARIHEFAWRRSDGAAGERLRERLQQSRVGYKPSGRDITKQIEFLKAAGQGRDAAYLERMFSSAKAQPAAPRRKRPLLHAELFPLGKSVDSTLFRINLDGGQVSFRRTALNLSQPMKFFMIALATTTVTVDPKEHFPFKNDPGPTAESVFKMIGQRLGFHVRRSLVLREKGLGFKLAPGVYTIDPYGRVEAYDEKKVGEKKGLVRRQRVKQRDLERANDASGNRSRY